MMNNLPAQEQIEGGIKAMASMCSLFHKQLIRDGMPVEVAQAMVLAFTTEITRLLKPQQSNP